MGLALDVGYASVLTAAAPWLALRAARTGRYREGWSERLLGRVPRTQPGQSSIWIHGVSLGEVQLLKPLVHHFQQNHPNDKVVLSTSTLTGMQVARTSVRHEDAFYCPLDFSWAVRQAIERLKPKLIVLGELEVWPHLIGIAHQNQIPIAVVNGRLSDRSFRGYLRFRSLLGSTFEKLNLVAAQDATTARRFAELGVAQDRIHVTGSLKFDNVTADRNHPEVVKCARLVGIQDSTRVFVAGSTQAPEEEISLRSVASLIQQYPDLRLIVVPRHPERFDEVANLLQSISPTGPAERLKVVRRSQLTQACSIDDWHVLLVDTVGELKWWWGLAELALVGGSFGSRGGQNMLEPAAYGAKVAFGPNVWNFRAIVHTLKDQDAVWQLGTLDEIQPWLSAHLCTPELDRERTERAVRLIQSHQGATSRTCQLLESLMR